MNGLTTVEPRGVLPNLLQFPRPCRVVRPCPSVFEVQGIAQRIERRLPSRRRDVQRTTARQLDPWRYEVQLHPCILSVSMTHPQDVELVRLESGERHALELVHHLLLLLGRGCVLDRERHDARRVPPLPLDAVDQLLGPLWVAT